MLIRSTALFPESNLICNSRSNLRHQVCVRGMWNAQTLRMFQMALAAGMTANNVMIDPRDIALLTCSYHIVELSTASGLLVRTSWSSVTYV